MRYYWSDDIRFSSDNFGFQPTWLIIQALHYGAMLRGEKLHLQELGIATLSALFCQANSDPKKGDRVKPSDFWHFLPFEDKDKIDSVVADTFFALVAEEKIPSWAVAIAPIEKLRASRGDGTQIPTTRAWMRKGVLLIAPRIQGTQVVARMAIVERGVEGKTGVIDVDSGKAFEVHIPNDKSEAFWVSDSEYEIVAGVLNGINRQRRITDPS